MSRVMFEDLKVGMRVEVVGGGGAFFEIGSSGVISDTINQSAVLVKFDKGEYDHDCDGEWWVYPNDKTTLKIVDSLGVEDEDRKTDVPCLFEGDTLPKYGKEGDSALDLHAFKFREVSNGELLPVQDFGEEGYVLQPHDRILVPTGLKLSIPEGIDADVRPRSGLALKHGIVVQLGTLDNNYTGDVGMIVLNTSNEEYVIHKGDRLGQLKFSELVYVNLVEGEIKATERGESGYGDSGR